MNIECVSVALKKKSMDLSPGEDRYIPLVSAELASSQTKLGKKAFYVGYGSTAPLAMAPIYSRAYKKGDRTVAVHITLRVKTANKDDLVVKDLKDLKKTNTLVLLKMRKPVSDVMIAYWNAWLESHEDSKCVSKQDRQHEFSTLNAMTDMVSKYPVFLDYLSQQSQFKHIKHYQFKARTVDRRVVTLMALYDPDIPKGGIVAERLQPHIHPVLPKDMPSKNDPKTNVA